MDRDKLVQQFHSGFNEFVRDRGIEFEYLGYSRGHSQVAIRITGIAGG